MSTTTPLAPLPGTRPVVREVDPRTDRGWELLARQPGASLFTSPPWLRAVCGSYDFEVRAAVAVQDDVPVAGLASIDLDDHRGARRSALPFSDRADPIVPDPRMWPALLAAATRDDTPFTLRCLDGTAPVSRPGLRRMHDAAWHGTTTTAPPDDLLAGLHPGARRNIRTAQRAGVEVLMRDDIESVGHFHAMHVALRRRKYGLLAQPRTFFERIWSEFAPDDGIVTMLATVDGHPAAGAMFLVWNDVLYYKFGASLPEALGARPNDAIFWTAIRWANERGLRLVDWGLSELDQPGLVAYKRKWSDQERRIVTLTSAPDVPPPAPSPMSEALAELTSLLTEESVPLHVTERAGALLYRFFC